MPRLRYSLADAEAEAIRLANKYVNQLPLTEAMQLLAPSAKPSKSAPLSEASKHPVVWVVIYNTLSPHGDAWDGGELILDVNIETLEVRPWYGGYPVNSSTAIDDDDEDQ